MAKIKPGLRTTETYTEQNFLRLQITPRGPGADPLVTLEHFFCAASAPASASDSDSDSGSGSDSGSDSKSTPDAHWRSVTIVDAEPMPRQDALLIARSYAAENAVPVVYECRPD